MADRLLTIAEVMERLRISRATLGRWNKTDKLRAVKLGKAVRYREEDVQRIMREGVRED